MLAGQHQFIERATGTIRNEIFFGEGLLGWLYGPIREHAPSLFRMLTGPHFTELLGRANYDLPLSTYFSGYRRFLRDAGVNLDECLDDPGTFRTARDFFERRIRYWENRPMPSAADTVVAPADSRVTIGSLRQTAQLFIKNKFFDLAELFGPLSHRWSDCFEQGAFAVFRLTPDKYHYNHMPVSGEIADIYTINGACHSCNPGVMLYLAHPLAKNERVVTIINTDVPGGTGVGLVAMIEVVALMIGRITQCYSARHYDNPRPLCQGMPVIKGVPKSLFHPGSSTDVLLFQPGRLEFAEDLRRNCLRRDVNSRLQFDLQRPLVETDVRVRSLIATGAT